MNRPQPIDRFRTGWKDSSFSALEHHLQLTDRSTADVVTSPTQGDQDRSCHDDDTKVHGFQGWSGDPNECESSEG